MKKQAFKNILIFTAVHILRYRASRVFFRFMLGLRAKSRPTKLQMFFEKTFYDLAALLQLTLRTANSGTPQMAGLLYSGSQLKVSEDTDITI